MLLEFKDELDMQDLHRMTPKALLVLIEFFNYCKFNNLPCLITSLMEDVPGRRSTTHSDGRAFDASIRGWHEKDIKTFVKLFNKKYENLAAISAADHVPRLVVFHKIEGGAPHLHIQVSR